MIARVFALGILVAGATSTAHAQGYVRGGLTSSEADPYDSAVGFELAGGYSFGAWRGELSVDSNAFDVSVGNFARRFRGTDGAVTSAFASLYYDFDTESFMTPYIGGGLGLSNIDAPLLNGETDTHLGQILFTVQGFNVTEVVWQGALGVDFAFTPNLSLDASLRYATYPDKKYFYGVQGDELTADSASQARLALRYVF